MPSATFYDLPAEKRERLLRAAREEFFRIPYESASVNRIIWSAGIPRGSFHMYFTDKEELFDHLMDSYGALLECRIGEVPEQRERDLFTAFLNLFDRIQAYWGDGKYHETADIFRCNRQMQPGVLLNREGPKMSLARLQDRVGLSRLDLCTEIDLSDIFHLLVSAVAGTLVAAGTSGDLADARARLMRVFDILRRGAAPETVRREEAWQRKGETTTEATRVEPEATVVPPERLGRKNPQLTPPKKKRKWVKRLVTLLVITALLVLTLPRYMSAGTQALNGAYLPYTVTTHDMTVVVSDTDTIEPIQSYKVTTPVNGETLEAPFEEGQTVHKGDVFFRTNASGVENNIEQLQLSVRPAQLALNDLLKIQSDSQRGHNIKADDVGVITGPHVDRGDSVTVGTVTADVLDRNHMKLKVPSHSADVSGFYVGQAVTVTVNGTAETMSGAVEFITTIDEVGPDGTLVHQVIILVNNPGVLSETSQEIASMGGAACASSSSFICALSSRITTKVTGDLNVLNVKEGGRVPKGQVIGVISEAGLGTQVENTRIALKNTQFSLKNAQEKLEDCTIISTIDGEVIEKNLDVDDNISDLSSSGASAIYPAIIYDRSEFTFDMDVGEKDINKIQVGQKTEITADALDDQSFTGVVDKVNINGTTTSGHASYPVTVEVEGSPEAFYPSMSVSVKTTVGEMGNVLVLPAETVKRGNAVSVVKEGCLDENGVIKDLSTAKERQVTLGRDNDEYIEIMDGLEEGGVALAPSPQGFNPVSAIGMG